ncbi:hypothetical protein V1477_014141, partial [Vespula maculifrons]
MFGELSKKILLKRFKRNIVVGPIKTYKPNQCNFTERLDEELIVKLPDEKFQKFYALTSIIMQQVSKCSNFYVAVRQEDFIGKSLLPKLCFEQKFV